MSASEQHAPKPVNTMKQATAKARKPENIFVDRRMELVDRREALGGIGYINCRRQLRDRRRCKYVHDIREWWLRVNYVAKEEQS